MPSSVGWLTASFPVIVWCAFLNIKTTPLDPWIQGFGTVMSITLSWAIYRVGNWLLKSLY